MFAKVFAFEFRYQVRQPVFWVTAVVFFLLAFGATASDQIHIGDSANVHKNAPYAIAEILLILTIFFMFVTTAFVADVIVRDTETGFGPIIRSTGISKFDYLIGRFAGAFAAAALVFLVTPLAIVIGSMAPWLDPDVLGPFRFQPYLYAYVVLALPGLFLTASAFFALATVTRSMMATYVGVVVFLVVWIVATLWASRPELAHTAALFEPFGDAAYDYVTRYWTAAERNALTPPLTGPLLGNRLMALGLSLGFLALAYRQFHFDERSAPARRSRAPPRPAADRPALIAPRVRPAFNARSAVVQLWARTRLDVGQVLLSPAYLVLLVLGVINSAAGLWLVNTYYGVPIHPVTRVMVTELRGDFGLFALLIGVYYAGDLVWRERDRNTHEIVDATPLPDWAFVVPKTLAIGLVLVSTLIIAVLTALVVQALRGYFNPELGKYALWYLLPRSIDVFLIAALAVFVQSITPHKIWGWAVMVLFVISRYVLPNLGLEHFLYRYGQSPEIPLSDMNGLGRFWIGAAWFRVYWSAFALALLVLSYGLWRRGMETRLLPRLRRLPHRLAGPPGVLIAVAALAFACAGGWIYFNTNVLNPYRSQKDDERWQADFEKALIRYESTPQPKIVDVRLDVDIRPRTPAITTRGVYVVENTTSQPLREIHVRFPRDLVMRSLSIEGARPKLTYNAFNYRIFTFDTPMAPGERRTMAFETVLTQRGFKNDRNLTDVVQNGTFVNDRQIAPCLGIDRRDLLQDRRKRSRYGLPRELRMPKLGTPGADQFNYFSRDSDWVTADVRVSTDADQVPIAPGDEISEQVVGGRRTAEFRTGAPIIRDFSIQSARYELRREDYKGLQLSVFYDQHHPWNVARMMTAMKASLDYDQANFGPYQFHYMRFLEFPQWDGLFAQSFAGTVPWSEDLGFITDLPKEGDEIDYVTYVGAHEVAHQWWAHQVIGADEQGSTLLSETLAQYSALMVMKHMYGPDMIRRFLKYELDRYLRARGGDVLPEQPLERVEDQDYIHYRKGALVMYRLQDEIGEDAVNRALRRLIARFAFKGPPYPTALDLVADLRAEAPPDKQALITDLFEKITLYDLKATRAVAKKRPDGRYDVALTVSARKLYADGLGRETQAPMSETLDIGAFASEPGKTGFDRSKVLALAREPIGSGVQTVHIVTDKPPRFAGVDPYNKLIDRNADDNLIAVGR
jgi:aminopeptidase N